MGDLISGAVPFGRGDLISGAVPLGRGDLIFGVVPRSRVDPIFKTVPLGRGDPASQPRIQPRVPPRSPANRRDRRAAAQWSDARIYIPRGWGSTPEMAKSRTNWSGKDQFGQIKHRILARRHQKTNYKP